MLGLLKKLKRKKKVESQRYEICISGQGGQGILLTGMVLAEAVALFEGKNVVQTQSYGPESRGGASKCEVIINNDDIFYTKTID